MTDEETPKWIETLSTILGHLGGNRTQIRWRLIRWNDRRKKPTSGTPVRRVIMNRPEAFSLSTALAIIIMTAYARVWVAQGGGFSDPPGDLLLRFGGHWQLGRPDDYWRLVTAMFLHIGLVHLLFNLISIATVGPQVEAVYGRLTMIFLFIATGIAGNLLSGVAQPNVLSAGASGGICGLIGAAAAYGHRQGNGAGIDLRNGMLKWLAYTIIFGFVAGANNYAHAGGAIAGAAFGYFVKPAVWYRKALMPLRLLAQVFGVICTLGALAIILTR